MIACFDVHYQHDRANAAAVAISDWKDSKPAFTCERITSGCGQYKAGKFYQRELAPLTELIQHLPATPEIYVIDAYCHLSRNFDPGLGSYLHDILRANRW